MRNYSEMCICVCTLFYMIISIISLPTSHQIVLYTYKQFTNIHILYSNDVYIFVKLIKPFANIKIDRKY